MASKKVFIITRHAIANYGSLFQSIASIKIFEEFGFRCEIIDYISKDESIVNNLINYAKNRGYHGFKILIYLILKLPNEIRKYFLFKKARNKYLNMTKKFRSFDNNDRYFNNSILCSGSDQLWGYMPNMKIDKNYYLEFGNNSNVYISLSSSFGRYDFRENEKDLISQYLKKYSYITVREKSSVSFLEKMFISSKFILDPTLIVDKELWLKLCKIRKRNKKYILVYKLRQDDKLNDFAYKLHKDLDLDVIYITNTPFNRISCGKNLVNPKSEIVLSLFRDAKYIVTDSFHATVFSIIFEKDFYVHLPDYTNSRIVDLLDSLDLNERAIDNATECKADCHIDYKIVNNKLNVLVEKSRSIIQEMVSEVR